MKKSIFKFLVSIFIIVIMGTMAFSQTYTITRITDNGYADENPKINNNDKIVWVGKPDVPYWAGNAGYEIFLYDGSSIIRLTDNEFEDSNPQINDNDYIVWQGFDGYDFEIFLFNGSEVIQITDNDDYNDVSPQIDNNNNVVWRRYFTYHTCGDNDIFIYDGSSTTKINFLNACNGDPLINNLGHVVWIRCNCGPFGASCIFDDCDLFFYDRTSTVNLTDAADRTEVNPQINDNDCMVWTAGVSGVNQEVFLFDGSTITRLTDNGYHDMYPQINNNGYVTWEGPHASPDDEEIFLYDGSSIIQLTDNLYPDNRPKINNNNDVVWEGRPGVDWADCEIFLYNGSSTMRLTEDDYIDLNPQINDKGSVAWHKYLGLPNWEIYLATPDQVHSTEIQIPAPGEVLQDAITLTADISGFSYTPELYMYIREPGGSYGVPIGYENLVAAFNASTGRFEFAFNTTVLQDGNYIIFAKVIDSFGNEILSEAVPFSIRNWTVLELLPATKNNKAGRTMPIKFSIRIAESVNPALPFVRNEELEVRIYDKNNPANILQISRFGTNSRDYRIDSVSEHYITNFKTKKEPAEYRVEIWRLSQDFLIGSFNFETVK